MLRADEDIRHIMGENGILRSKFIKFQKEVDLSYSELNELISQKRELYEIVNSCQRDIKYVINTISYTLLLYMYIYNTKSCIGIL